VDCAAVVSSAQGNGKGQNVTVDVARAFAEALGRKDAESLKTLLHEDVDFRAMTPGAFWEADSAATVVDDILLGTWFTTADEITDILDIEVATVGARERVGYRFDVSNGDGRHVVEQQAYLQSEDGRIGWLRVMCAGYQPFS
jgi:hypothetical protein